MQATWRAAPILLAAFLALASPAAHALDDPAARTRVTTLENGLTVLTLVDDTTPVVSFQMWAHVGSRDETRYTGLAHLFEHMMFGGSKNVPAEGHAQLLGARGGEVNAYTTNDYTTYFDDVTSESMPLVIDLEHERVAHLDISEPTLARERKVVLEERRLRTEDSPMGRAYEALFGLVWQALPYRWPVIGWRSDIEKATVDVCRKFFGQYYVPNNLVLAIVGSFDEEAVLARIRRTFGTLDRVPDIPRNPTEEPKQQGERRATVYFDLRAPILAAGWHAPPTGHPDGEALDVLSTILSAGHSSRLYRSLVYDAQQALSAEGGYWELEEAGVFLAFASVRPGASIDRVEQLFFDEIERLKREPPSADELEKAKRQLEVSLVDGLETNHELAERIGRDYITLGRIRPLDERLERIRAVTAEDVQRVARSYLVKDQRSVVQIVPAPPGPAAGGGEAAKEGGP
ncbi:MAG TPA: pitrilysin family protein [Myxococcota bacterium]|nr:pitrilysin family protein [Myxococcota bacterium]